MILVGTKVVYKSNSENPYFFLSEYAVFFFLAIIKRKILELEIFYQNDLIYLLTFVCLKSTTTLFHLLTTHVFCQNYYYYFR